MVRSEKIFGIGGAKTGTTSLGAALGLLGFAHKSYDATLSRVHYEAGDYEPIYAVAERYESFDDGPWNRGVFYRELDRRFPGSRFILTVRDPVTWLRSYESHFAPRRRGGLGAAEGARILAAHQSRNAEVLAYFRRRPRDLLVLDICGGEGWEELCSFLGVEPPDLPFPRENVTARKRRARLHRLARRLWRGGAPLRRRA